MHDAKHFPLIYLSQELWHKTKGVFGIKHSISNTDGKERNKAKCTSSALSINSLVHIDKAIHQGTSP